MVTKMVDKIGLKIEKSPFWIKELRALRGYFGPPMRPKYENRFTPNSSYRFIRTMTRMYKSDISLTFTIAMVTKMAVKTG